VAVRRNSGASELSLPATPRRFGTVAEVAAKAAVFRLGSERSRQFEGSDVKQRVFQQGDRVMWRDASGERQRGHVLQHSRGRLDGEGAERDEEVLVMRDGSSHISVLPPNALVLSEL
jgi:hypothetical protein